MTEENKKENIKAELERALNAMSAAHLLFENGYINDSISKLYYSLLYSVRALLLTKGLEPKSHEGALRMFGLHFVKESILEPRDSHVFSRMMKFREEADYNPSYVFTTEDFLEFKKDVQELSGKIETFLSKKGYL